MSNVPATFGPHPGWASPFYFLVSTYGWLGWLIVVLAAIGAIAVLSRAMDGAVVLALRLPQRRNLGATPAPADGRDVLRAQVRAASIPDLEVAALDRARVLYGADANLTVEAVEDVATSTAHPGEFLAAVYVRRLPGVAPAPAAVKPSTQEASTQS